MARSITDWIKNWTHQHYNSSMVEVYSMNCTYKCRVPTYNTPTHTHTHVIITHNHKHTHTHTHTHTYTRHTHTHTHDTHTHNTHLWLYIAVVLIRYEYITKKSNTITSLSKINAKNIIYLIIKMHKALNQSTL